MTRRSGAPRAARTVRGVVGLVVAASALLLCACSTGPLGPAEPLEPPPAASMPDGWAVGAPPGGDATVAAFYGDSYTRGTGASGVSTRWSTIVCAEHGWVEFNPSVDGLGFVNNRELLAPGDDLVERIVDLDPAPDIVIVTMGLNDNFSMPARADEIRAAIDGDLTRLAGDLPDARLVVVEPFWYSDDRPASVAEIDGWVADAAADVGAEFIPGASRWIEGHPEWMAADGLHPNDDGYAEIARRMDEELARLGL